MRKLIGFPPQDAKEQYTLKVNRGQGAFATNFFHRIKVHLFITPKSNKAVDDSISSQQDWNNRTKVL
jgi:hypothetical protein